jgi:hypothetical protein
LNHDLAAIAEMLGVTTSHHDSGPKGWYSPAENRISTRRGLSIADYRSTFAHELGHAVYHDQRTGHGHFDHRQEVRADQFAARLLIDPDEIDGWLRFYGPCNLPAVANEIDVTPHLLNIYFQNTDKGTARDDFSYL